MFCKNCGSKIDDEAKVCQFCGKNVEGIPTNNQNSTNANASELIKKGWFLAIMCFFFGGLGVHRFLVGKIGTGVLWLLTGGLLGIGALVDFIMILCSAFTDKDGNKISLT